jgi:Membrane-bound lysozyme-inhibitor of c-type lysozyme
MVPERSGPRGLPSTAAARPPIPAALPLDDPPGHRAAVGGPLPGPTSRYDTVRASSGVTRMNRTLRIALSAAVLSACLPALVHAQNIHITERPAAFNPHTMKFKSGAYRCELGKQVQVRAVSADLQTAHLNWNQRDYTMRAVTTRSGALRYEDADSGLVWLMIPGKSMLLDTRQGQRLANECRA